MPNTTKDSENTDFAITRGTLKKPIYEMTIVEREAFYKNMKLETHSQLFSIGQPFVHLMNGKILAEYADGTINIIR